MSQAGAMNQVRTRAQADGDAGQVQAGQGQAQGAQARGAQTQARDGSCDGTCDGTPVGSAKRAGR